MGSEINALFGKFKSFSYAVRIVAGDFLRKTLGFDRAGRFQRNRALDGVFKLTDITRPDIILQQSDGTLTDRQRAARTGAELLDEVLRQIANVFCPFA